MTDQYNPGDPDKPIIGEITNKIRASLVEWYGRGSRLNSAEPEISAYQHCFILRYPVSISPTVHKAILVKIRRNPEIDSLQQAIQSDIHQTLRSEYRTLESFYERLTSAEANFGAIRPLLFVEKYFAILMEEYPSRTMHQLMEVQRTARAGWNTSELKDAARKTGQWLYYFHHHFNTAFEKRYTSRDLLQGLQPCAEKIETLSQERVHARLILDAFASRVQNLPIDRVKFSRCHLDMTTDNVFYSADGKVGITGMENLPGPVYEDLGQIITYPETSKPQILSGSTYYSEALLRNYRAEIIAGYFEQEPGEGALVRIYSARRVVDKWSMYEEQVGQYKDIKRSLSFPASQLITIYFQDLLREYLDPAGDAKPGQALKLDETPVDTSF